MEGLASVDGNDVEQGTQVSWQMVSSSVVRCCLD